MYVYWTYGLKKSRYARYAERYDLSLAKVLGVVLVGPGGCPTSGLGCCGYFGLAEGSGNLWIVKTHMWQSCLATSFSMVFHHAM